MSVRSKEVTFIVMMLFLASIVWDISSLPGKHGLEEFTQSCTIVKDHDGRSPKTLLMTIGVVLPTSILVIANSMIYYKVSFTVSELTQVEVALT